MTSVSTFQYVFQALTPAGAKTFGVRAASSESTLADELRREQLLLVKAWRLPLGAAAPALLPLRDEFALNDQLSMLLARGVPLVEALEVAATVVNPVSRSRLQQMREHVAAGSSFAQACEKAGGFDAVTTAVYRAAERTGDLAGATRRLAVSAKRRQGIKGKAITVMIYPAIVFSIAVLLAGGLLVFLVPMIAAQMRQMKATPNAFSQAVFSLGIWLNSHLLLTSCIVAGLIILALVLRRRVAASLVRIAQRLPAIAGLLLTIEMARFFSVMAAMVKSGVPLGDALSTAAQVISNPRLRSQLEGLQRGLVEGGLWRILVERVDALPLSTRRLLVAAERGGDLDSAFDALSSDLAEEVDVRSGRLLALLEPAAIVLMFLLIGPLILAIAIPLLTFRTSV